MSATRKDTLNVAGIDVGSSAVKIAFVEDTGDYMSGALTVDISGAGAGTAAALLTGKRNINFPPETVLRFRLEEELKIQP